MADLNVGGEVELKDSECLSLHCSGRVRRNDHKLSVPRLPVGIVNSHVIALPFVL